MYTYTQFNRLKSTLFVCDAMSIILISTTSCDIYSGYLNLLCHFQNFGNIISAASIPIPLNSSSISNFTIGLVLEKKSLHGRIPNLRPNYNSFRMPCWRLPMLSGRDTAQIYLILTAVDSIFWLSYTIMFASIQYLHFTLGPQFLNILFCLEFTETCTRKFVGIWKGFVSK